MTRSSGSTTGAPTSVGSTEFSPWILGYRGPALPRNLRGAITDGRISGLILFRDNFGPNVASARDAIRELRSLVPAGRPFLLAMDEEGGLISQTSDLEVTSGRRWPALPTPRALGRIGDRKACRHVGAVLGRRLRSLGVDVDFAPCLDLDVEARNPVIGSRSFGADPALVADLASEFALGLLQAGVVPCFKHWPGHGGTVQDSHRTLPRMDPGVRALHEAPYRLLLAAKGSRDHGRGWIMSAHIDWGDGLPASLSKVAVARLCRLAPGRVRVTDALDMGAVDLAAGAGRQALLAGHDFLLVGRDAQGGMRALAALVEEARTDRRVRAALARARRRTASFFRSLTEAQPKRRPPSEDLEAIRSMHRRAVRLDREPSALPSGPWLWIVPEGLAPYVRLSGWRPPRGRERSCQEVIWVPQRTSVSWVRNLGRRLEAERRPVLLATLLRGAPQGAVGDAWGKVARLPAIWVIAHLLDERWPAEEDLAAARRMGAVGERRDGGVIVAQTSGPSREALTALAEALDRTARAWVRGREGLWSLRP